VGRELSHDELAGLLGAYALDAVDAEEATAVTAHLEHCPRCAAEVAEHLEVAGLIANAGVDAPPELWERISAGVRSSPAIADGPTRGRGVAPTGRPGHAARQTTRAEGAGGRARRAWWGVAGAAAAAAVAVIAVLGVQVSHLDGRVGQLASASERTGMAQAVQAALLDPRARTVPLTAAGGRGPGPSGRALVLVILPDGSAFALNTGLPALTADHTYQLWGAVGTRLVSLGVLGSHPGDVALHVGDPGAVRAYAVTAERAGGAVQPTGNPLARSAATT
jgi:anti-sigma factor RsiW